MLNHSREKKKLPKSKLSLRVLLTPLKPLNLIVPLKNVSQSFIPNLSWNTVLSRFGYTSNFMATEKSSRSSTDFKGSSVTIFFPSFKKIA